ncbi:peptide ABC transporter ATP-binding protein [Brachybacterium endophyticum]|uniref:Peptide ABC transporter ATP-binding protein n=1 Tax=Brachybacterium endophyticum TaxID=2182385 RepID=A0A2U2RK19_9MICO|nr:ABC transporter ATP-binding protein [Brachybacterium endophyticum]PWH06124.1 peptide ABC transporter ATP-binding protein [Brachybacterium endophyticum]
MAPSSALIASDVHAGYPGQAVLDGIDLEIRAGQPPMGLLGPSGAGKTTLIDVLRGALKPTSGQVSYEGRRVSRLRGAVRREFTAEVRFVSQYAMTITDPRATASGALQNAAREARKAGRTHAVTAAEMLAAVGLEERFASRTLRSLSGGETQRVALATALSTRPKILVLDEPLTAVDPGMRAEIASTLRTRASELGVGMLIASHDLELLSALCESVAFLGEGRILARGSMSEVLGASEHPVIRDLAASAPIAVQRFR